jgi:hypothetical protein
MDQGFAMAYGIVRRSRHMHHEMPEGNHGDRSIAVGSIRHIRGKKRKFHPLLNITDCRICL